MFRYNPKANYQPNGGCYLQILSGKDLYKQTIVMSAGTHDIFPVRFPNIFVDYPLGQMHVGFYSVFMANAVEFYSVVVCIVCLRGQFCAPELYQASNDLVGLSFSCLLSCEVSSEKITDSIATRDRF